MSRIVFVILLALNLGALAWALTRPPESAQPLPNVQPGVAPLVLLGERDGGAMQAAVEAVAVAEQVQDLPAPECRSLGPFADRDAVQEALAALQPLTEQTQVRTTTVRVVRGYWVHIPVHPNRAEALATARQLASAGVRDYYVVTAGEQENSVALGLFRDKENAEKRLAQVTALGFRVRVNERADQTEQFWLDYRYRGVEPDWKPLLGSASRLSARTTSCSG